MTGVSGHSSPHETRPLMDQEALLALRESPLGPYAKGIPPSASDLRLDQVGSQGWHVLGDELIMPVAILYDSALSANISTLQNYCIEQNVSLAPHGKTTMSPQLHWRQLREGAWGLSAAVPHQVKIYRAFGVSRILLANQLVDPVALAWILDELTADPDLDFYCYVDSEAGLRLLAETLESRPHARSPGVLVELGYSGGRSGCRTLGDALKLARTAAASSHVDLAGIAGYEGTLGARDPETIRRVDTYLHSLRSLVDECVDEGLFDHRDEIVVTAGGSAFFDRVIEIVGPTRPNVPLIRTVIRSGTYVAHDTGFCSRNTPTAEPSWMGSPLVSAFQVWGVVLSRPQQDLALLNLGRRDVGTDAGMPVPQVVWRRRQDRLVPLSTVEIVAVHDQHSFLRLVDESLEVGDLVGCGISHPCTNLDKWEVLFLVDDDLRIIDAVRTFF